MRSFYFQRGFGRDSHFLLELREGISSLVWVDHVGVWWLVGTILKEACVYEGWCCMWFHEW
jgi:hypothetical protein